MRLHNFSKTIQGGLRIKGKKKARSPNKPLISIITAVYNEEDNLEETIKSIVEQSHKNIEYIIIDGKSSDGTVGIIKKYEDQIDFWISEPDKGIYDAMNKGIKLASGDWLNFMNAGDSFYNNDVILNIFKDDRVKYVDFIYGHHQIRYEGGFKKVKKAGDINKLWQGMKFFHQSSFVKSAYVKDCLFNIHNQIGADFELIYKMYKNRNKFLNIDKIISSVSAGGISDKDRVGSIKSWWKTVGESDPSTVLSLYYIVAISMCMIKSFLKKMLPYKVKLTLLKLRSGRSW